MKLARWIGAALLAAMACAPLPAAAAKTTLTIGMGVEPAGLDPTSAAPVAIREVTWNNLFEGLVALDPKGAVVPLLAKDWTVSGDGLTYTFHLREGVRFHNGVPFDSSVVKFSLDRARGPDSTNAQKQFFEPIADVATPDPLTAVITLKEPAGLFLYWLAWGDAVMVEPSSVATEATQPVGTGPFRFKDWVRGDRVVLERNPDYWGPAPALETVTFRFIGDAQAQAAALRAGDVDAVPNFTAPELFAEFQSDPRFAAVAGLSPRKLVAGMNNGKPPFNDVRVRRALMMAIDRQAVIEGAYSGYGTAIGSHWAPSDSGYVDLTGVIPYDPAGARALLAEAGYANGLTFTIKVPQFSHTTRAAEIMQAMFAEVGVTMKIEPSEFPAKWIDDVFLNKDYEMTIIDHAEPMDIDIYTRPNYYFDYHNPQLDAVVAKAEATADAAARNALYGEAQKILAEDVPALYLFALPRLGIWDAHLEGIWHDEPISQLAVKDVRWTD
jgi:peptide/nickel transport system substrate-binding protein